MPGRPGTKGNESHLVSFYYVFYFHLSLSVVFYTQGHQHTTEHGVTSGDSEAERL